MINKTHWYMFCQKCGRGICKTKNKVTADARLSDDNVIRLEGSKYKPRNDEMIVCKCDSIKVTTIEISDHRWRNIQ